MTIPAITDAAQDLFVRWEVTSRKNYESRLQFPTWPGGASGVTVGIGFDCGYESEWQIRQDWSAHLSPRYVDLLCSVAGRQGAAANHALRSVAEVVVPWDAAWAVFKEQNLPRYAAMTQAAFQHTDELPPDSFWALVALVFNRGPGMVDPTGDPNRRLEMRQIRDAMEARAFPAVPGYIRGMKRLWPDSTGVGGLRQRRDDEADLFAEGLLDAASAPAPDAASSVPPAPAEPPETQAAAPAPAAPPQPVEVAQTIVPFLKPAPSADDLNAAELERIQQQPPEHP